MFHSLVYDHFLEDMEWHLEIHSEESFYLLSQELVLLELKSLVRVMSIQHFHELKKVLLISC